jgi:flagellin-like hook-associated protein FlgL
MRISTLAQNTLVKQQVSNLQGRMLTLQSQISTGQKASSFHELRTDSSRVLTLRNQLQTVDNYQQTISLTETRITVMQESFQRVRQIGEEASLNAVQGVYENLPRLPTVQMKAETQLSEVVGLANQTVDGRALFAGREVGTSPVVEVDEMLNGDPATGRKGLLDLIADRAAADKVDDFAEPGRLALSTVADNPAVGDATVRITDDVEAFGFTVQSFATSSTSVGFSTDVSAPPARTDDIEITGPVPAGETITVTLGLPDGSSLDLTLTATNDGSEVGDGVFLTDTASPLNTANNLRGELADLLREHAEVELKAASAVAAGNMFFDTVPPTYVDDPFGTPSVRTDDAANPQVVQWYLGDTDDDPRAGQRARISDGTTVEYGVRADETAIKDSIKGLALYASIGFAETTGEVDMYRDFADRVARDLSVAGGGLKSLIGEIGVKEETIVSVKAHHVSFKTLTNNQLVDIEGVDLYEASTKLSSYETQLQASYAVTNRLQQLSLVNFMPR